jgi:hypothetical protein
LKVECAISCLAVAGARSLDVSGVATAADLPGRDDDVGVRDVTPTGAALLATA